MKLDEIAALAGVSRTTASCVINGKADQYRISQATRDKVMAVVHAHTYQPDSRAASLRGGQTRTLGFILPDLENASYAKLAKRLEQGARTQGYQLLIVCSEDDPDTEKELARMLVRPAEMASVWRSRIMGMLTTLVTKISPANTPPTRV